MAEKLSVSESDIKRTANLIADGGIVAFPFNGIFGIFGRDDDPTVTDRIYEAKNRPPSKGLVAVTMPELVARNTDLAKLPYGIEKVRGLMRALHGIGVIMPASELAPSHLVQTNPESGLRTLLTIYTNYHPLNSLLEMLKLRGITGLAGTSANKSGQATHFEDNALWEDFCDDLDAIVMTDEFRHMGTLRNKSTSIVDLTFFLKQKDGTSQPMPKLHRWGNTTKEEIALVLHEHRFPALYIDETTLIVTPREGSDTQPQEIIQKTA